MVTTEKCVGTIDFKICSDEARRPELAPEVEDGLRSWVCAARSSTELAGSRRVRAN